MFRRLGRLLAAAALTVGASGAVVLVEAAPAHADGCYTWSGVLSEGSSGEAVRQLQIRVAGYPSPGSALVLDGAYGANTKDAVARFQAAYGLTGDGVAGSDTFNKLYALQDDDCTPINFAYAELNDCNTTWSGGNVSAATAKANALVTMWKLQAMRHAMGDQPIRVTSGFRSVACNNAVGGASSSRHLYGDAADLGANPHTLCEMAKQARNHGFLGILGPGYPDHGDHVHVDGRSSKFWSAPNCGVSGLVGDGVDPVEGAVEHG
jgi:zinc D-Ala-D-Ala carboxypeptidase